MPAESSPSRGAGTAPSRSKAGGGANRLQQNICAFWLGENCYGLDISLVGEVVEVEALVPVPLTPSSVRGLFNLRGTPIALVDLAALLEPPEPAISDEPRPGKPLVALVLRHEELTLGFLIRRMEMVITRGKGVFSPAEATEDEHPTVQGFLDVAERGDLTVTVLATHAVLERIEGLKFTEGAARA